MADEFDDPDLKKALQRAWGEEGAPPELRDRVAASLAKFPKTLWTNYWGIYAAAAIILLASSLMMLSDLWTTHQPRLPVLPNSAAAAIMQTHDRCCLVNDHHFVPRQYATSMASTGRWLSSKASVPVLAVNMDEGWTYCGAGPCRVNGKPSGHLLFKRGDQDLSIFSLPAANVGLSGQNTEFSIDTENKHTYAAFVKNGGLYCIMSRDPSGQFGPAQVEAIRQSLMKNFAADVFAAGAGDPPPPPLAALLED